MMPVEIIKDYIGLSHYSNIEKKLNLTKPQTIPYVTYDNGIPCFEANLYLLSKLEEGKSTRVGGGTLRTYANQIIHLINFCYNNNIIFTQLTDSHFSLFIKSLIANRDSLGKLKRFGKQVRQIGTQCLHFLIYIQDFYQLKNFIGQDKGSTIRIKIKRTSQKIEGNKLFYTESLTHSSFPNDTPLKRRHPVSEESAMKVWEYINHEPNREKRIRDVALYSFLETTGARNSEVHMAMVKDIDDALMKDDAPLLRVTTLKRNNHERFIPVPQAFLSTITQYIRKIRRKVIKRTIGTANDHGYLFVNLKNGEPLSAESTRRRMNEWKKACEIKESFHPHLFRHAFITNSLKRIILQHNNINNADDFRKHLLHTEKFKLELQQWTGHTHISSLNTYIDLVFADINGYQKAYDQASLVNTTEDILVRANTLASQLKGKLININEATSDFIELIEAFKNDVNNAASRIE